MLAAEAQVPGSRSIAPSLADDKELEAILFGLTVKLNEENRRKSGHSEVRMKLIREQQVRLRNE